jgi:hypothetical protein
MKIVAKGHETSPEPTLTVWLEPTVHSNGIKLKGQIEGSSTQFTILILNEDGILPGILLPDGLPFAKGGNLQVAP